jgi:hypothetical protein
VTQFPALFSAGMHGTEHCIGKPCVIRRSAPLSSISLPKDRCFPAHRSLSSQRSRSLVTAFPSPATAAPSRKPPFQGKWSRPATSRPPDSICRPVRLRLHYLRWFAPVEGSFIASARCGFLAPVRPAASSISTPLWESCLPRDRSVRQIPPPCGSPSGFARFPFAPRRRSIARLAADHRSRTATFPEAADRCFLSHVTAVRISG